MTLKAVLAAVDQVRTEEGRQRLAVGCLLPLVFLIALLASPIAIFFAVIQGDDGTEKPIIEIINEIDAEMTGRVDATGEGADEFVIGVESDGASLTANWPDVLAVFSVRANLDMSDPKDVALLTPKHIAMLKQTYSDMNTVVSTSEEVTYTDENGDEKTKTVVSTTVESKGWQEMADFYHFDKKQQDLLERMMNPDYYPLYLMLLGMTPTPFDNMTPDEVNAIAQNLPPGQKTTELVKLALSKLGTPYSQERRNSPGYFDCSSFSHWVYAQMGLNISLGGSDTAAAQAQWCVENNLVVSYNDLQPGDLVFFSSKPNGRFMDVNHVALFAGDGMIVDASFSKGKIVYRPIWTSTLVLCARPSLKL